MISSKYQFSWSSSHSCCNYSHCSKPVPTLRSEISSLTRNPFRQLLREKWLARIRYQQTFPFSLHPQTSISLFCILTALSFNINSKIIMAGESLRVLVSPESLERNKMMGKSIINRQRLIYILKSFFLFTLWTEKQYSASCKRHNRFSPFYRCSIHACRRHRFLRQIGLESHVTGNEYNGS